ncbi:GNAT family N-acetyltransferase [Enterobacter sp. DTU_2021_1002640_1_SI_PRY_ASU_LCPMC_013]|uniref:GNAT family N-acetyltransferase n=1 Tax=Enterobacter sp. DTU_2021_1002640_1_SI_PRY_ASU_LCPMC_013 TaxID=3077940 RepID=UPI0028E2FE32|nr:GNAT family N-acetyltransferase [Enterobacter sp. DTU_2021_1002640_1_SI_PRY_ASU_LCPMC_013]WNU99105.1 GNAT family N-acetyltransferase [Enterobacter sp. DTU_2021_1002640_1_SI_PRY_ASU_LCPMC_013]
MNINKNFNLKSVSEREALREFLKLCWCQTYTKQLGEDITLTMIRTLDDESLGGLLDDKDIHVVLAMMGKKIIGSCMYAIRDNVAYIWGVYVIKYAQSSGTGRAMIEAVANAIPKNTAMQVIVLEVSIGAIEFYKNLGFKICGKTKYVLPDGDEQSAIIMTASKILLSKNNGC